LIFNVTSTSLTMDQTMSVEGCRERRDRHRFCIPSTVSVNMKLLVDAGGSPQTLGKFGPTTRSTRLTWRRYEAPIVDPGELCTKDVHLWGLISSRFVNPLFTLGHFD
jgi:hypothetical protein